MKVSDLIMKLIEGCGGNLNKELQYFEMKEYGDKYIPNVSIIFTYRLSQDKEDDEESLG